MLKLLKKVKILLINNLLKTKEVIIFNSHISPLENDDQFFSCFSYVTSYVHLTLITLYQIHSHCFVPNLLLLLCTKPIPINLILFYFSFIVCTWFYSSIPCSIICTFIQWSKFYHVLLTIEIKSTMGTFLLP